MVIRQSLVVIMTIIMPEPHGSLLETVVSGHNREVNLSALLLWGHMIIKAVLFQFLPMEIRPSWVGIMTVIVWELHGSMLEAEVYGDNREVNLLVQGSVEVQPKAILFQFRLMVTRQSLGAMRTMVVQALHGSIPEAIVSGHNGEVNLSVLVPLEMQVKV